MPAVAVETVNAVLRRVLILEEWICASTIGPQDDAGG